MKHLLIGLAALSGALQEPSPWRIVVEQNGKFASYLDSGTGHRDEPEFTPPKAGLSPDGKRRVYLRDDAEREEIWVSDADGGQARRLTDKADVDGSPAWSPDGRRLVFSSNRDGAWQIWRIDADGAGLARLTNHPEGARDPRVSPRGDVVAYFELHPRPEKLPPVSLRIVPLEGGDSRVALERIQMLGFAWSPSGDRLACSRVGELQILDAATLKLARALKLTDIGKSMTSHAAFGMVWRPDGGAIACKATFLGGRMLGAKLFGDNEDFILPLKGAPVTIELKDPGVPVRWIR